MREKIIAFPEDSGLPLTDAIWVGNTGYCSGQGPFDADGHQVEGDNEAQARAAFRALDLVCRAAGGSIGQRGQGGSLPA